MPRYTGSGPPPLSAGRLPVERRVCPGSGAQRARGSGRRCRRRGPRPARRVEAVERVLRGPRRRSSSATSAPRPMAAIRSVVLGDDQLARPRGRAPPRRPATTAWLRATPPWKRIGRREALALADDALEVAGQGVAQPGEDVGQRARPRCCRWIMSVLAKTVQRPAMRAGLFGLQGQLGELVARCASPGARPAGRGRSRCRRRRACSWRSRPAPSARWPRPTRRTRNLLSCPPISITVRASGWYSPTARVWATSSLTCGTPAPRAIGPPPDPVKPTALTSARLISARRSASMAASVSRGRPRACT